MNNIKIFGSKLFCILIIIFLLLGLCSCKDNVSSQNISYPSITENYYINDYADTIINADEDTMSKIGRDIGIKLGTQIIAVTVESVGEITLDEYAKALADNWNIEYGQKEDNYVLILLSTAQASATITVGDGAADNISPKTAEDIVEYYNENRFNIEAFSSGICELYSSVASEIFLNNGFDAIEGYEVVEEDTKEPSFFKTILKIFLIVVISIVTLGIIIFAVQIILLNRKPKNK